MGKNKFIKYISVILFLIAGTLFVAKFASGPILRLYIETGIGSCKQIPILCQTPSEEINNPSVDKDYINMMIPYKFPDLELSLPKGYRVVKEEIKKSYHHDKRKAQEEESIYIVAKKKGFFPGLFPQLEKDGIKTNYEFYLRTINSNLNQLHNLNDAFFVIMKSIFTPDLGNQGLVKMANISINGAKGFISYNLSNSGNYFDCIIFDKKDDFFKLYIKDTGSKLDLYKIYSILSTVRIK